MFELLWWHWLIVGIALLAADVLAIGSFYLMWLGLSCILVAVMLGLEPDFSLLTQVLAWGIFNVILLSGWLAVGKKRFFKQAYRPRKIIGIAGLITEWSQGSGKIRFQRPYDGDDVWNACSDDQFAVGDNAKVTAIQPTKQTVTVTKL